MGRPQQAPAPPLDRAGAWVIALGKLSRQPLIPLEDPGLPVCGREQKVEDPRRCRVPANPQLLATKCQRGPRPERSQSPLVGLPQMMVSEPIPDCRQVAFENRNVDVLVGSRGSPTRLGCPSARHPPREWSTTESPKDLRWTPWSPRPVELLQLAEGHARAIAHKDSGQCGIHVHRHDASVGLPHLRADSASRSPALRGQSAPAAGDRGRLGAGRRPS